jgi:excisionase family DNA binding protein
MYLLKSYAFCDIFGAVSVDFVDFMKKRTRLQGWLTLRDASRQAGVSPSTLRQWADQGRVRTFRTPGGHRRFSEADMRALMPHAAAPAPLRHTEMLVHSILGRARLEIAGGRLQTEAWYRRLDDAGREQHRELGRQLMLLLLKALRQEEEDAVLVAQAREMGRQYGRASLGQRISLSDALRAFLFFRDSISENLIDLFGAREADSLNAFRRTSAIVNEMLVAMVETYQANKED